MLVFLTMANLLQKIVIVLKKFIVATFIII